MVALKSAAAFASAAPVMTTPTCAGLHSALADTLASHWPLHSALISGGLTSPVHFGAFISAEHEPPQVPSHFAAALSLQLAAALALALALTLALPDWPFGGRARARRALRVLAVALAGAVAGSSGLDGRVALAAALAVALAPASTSQVPSHFASQEPESLPGSHSTFALPPETFASHLAAQSAMTPTLARQTGAFTTRAIFAFAPILPFTSPMALAAALQASSPVLNAVASPRSFAMPPQAVMRSASILAANSLISMLAMTPALSFAPASAEILNSLAKSRLVRASTVRSGS